MNKEGSYLAWDDMAVEVEVAECLYGLVRILKPKFVVETGTGQAYASRYIATALQDNDEGGKLWTFEPDAHWCEIAMRNLEGFPARVFNEHSLAQPWNPFLPKGSSFSPDLVFLDSGPTYRQSEIDFWLPKEVNLVIHDAIRYPELQGSGTFLPGRGLWIRTSP